MHRLKLLSGINEDGFNGDLLEGKLLLGLAEEPEHQGIRLVTGAELDFDGFADELGKRISHLAIENEGGISIELLLKLKDMGLVASPRAGLIHGQDEGVAAFIMGEGIEDGRVLEAHRAAGSGGGGFGAQSGWFFRQNLQNSQNCWNEIL